MIKDNKNILKIDSSRLLHNFDYFQSLSQFVFPVVKANAYGHGIIEVGEILKARQFPYLVFDKVYEYLNSGYFGTSMIMSPVEDLNSLDFDKVCLVVDNIEYLKLINSYGYNNSLVIQIHLELNTGMNRWGLGIEELIGFLSVLNTCEFVNLEGVLSHLADSDGILDEFTDIQVELFDNCIEKIIQFNFDPKFTHLGQTAGSVKINSKYCNTIRVGIGLYGLNNLELIDNSYTKLENITPVLSLNSVIIKCFKVKKGQKIGYNCTFEALNDGYIAVLPIGYFEGLNRQLGNRGYVKINNKYYHFAGKICMNLSMIDLGIDFYPLDTIVEIISNNKNDMNSIQNISNITGYFNYGLVTSLNSNLTRQISPL